MEETGRIEILSEDLLTTTDATTSAKEDVNQEVVSENQADNFADLDIKIEPQYDIEQVVSEVTAYV